jgi:ADP-heptose:LPS heptosyltransferase
MIRLPERPVLVVFELGFVGDSLMTLPTLLALRQAHPDAKLVRVINRAMSELWEGCPHADDIIAFDRKAPKLVEAKRVLGLLRGHRPDAFLNLHTPDRDRPVRFYWRDALFARRSGARFLLGWSHGLDSLLLTHPVPRSRFGADNMALEMFRVAEPLAEAPALDDVHFWHDDSHRAEGDRQLDEAGLEPGAAFLAVSPFGKDPAKELAPEDLGGLLARCHDATGLPAVLLGGPADVAKVAELRPAFGSPVLDLVGRNGLKVAAAILERASAVLAVDSGLMHLAALVGRPTVALFGPMPAHRWRPFRDEALTTFSGRTRGLLGDADREPFELDRIAAAVHDATEAAS